MKTFIINILFLVLLNSCLAQPIPTDSLYLGQTRPGNTPVVFNLPVCPLSFTAERIAISNDGKEIYYSVVRNYYPTAGDTIKYFKYAGNKWTGPFNLFNGYLAPAFSVTGDTMYFQNNNVPYQMLFSYRTGAGWSNPQRFLYSLNSAHYLQVTNNGNYYISSVSNPGMGASDWCRLYMSGIDSFAVSLGLPVNNEADNLDFFVSKDETFMILAKSGLKISFHKSNGDWTNPKSLGPAINFGLAMWGPFVTSDNKYLFYTTGTNPNYSDTRIHWVRIDGLMDSLKHTNFVPYLKNQIPTLTDTAEHYFNYTFPDTTFIDDDGNHTLTYSATLSDGNPLPSWLNFNPATRTFSGTPNSSGTVSIRIKATDSANISAYCNFVLIIANHTLIHELNGHTVNEYQLFQNYPNPFNPNTNITFVVPHTKGGLTGVVSLKVYDILGKEIATLVNEKLQPGTYEVSFEGSNLSSGIYFYTITASETNSNKVFKETKAMSYIK